MLTDEEKQIIEKAFNIVNRKNQYSCVAIEKAMGKEFEFEFQALTKKYGQFYEKNVIGNWDFSDLTVRQRRKARLMLLATFWELG